MYTVKGDDLLPCDRTLPIPPFVPPPKTKRPKNPFAKPQPRKEAAEVEVDAAEGAAGGGAKLLLRSEAQRPAGG